FESDVAFPLRFKRCDVHQNPATRISAFSETDREHVARDAEVFNSARQRETVWRNDYRLAFNVDEVLLVKLFRIDDGAVDVGEEFELVGAANVVTIARRSIRNDSF